MHGFGNKYMIKSVDWTCCFLVWWSDACDKSFVLQMFVMR